MNIVKGVADLIRRTSSGQAGEPSPSRQAERFSVPDMKIQFSEYGDEAILAGLWEKFDKAVDKAEKRKLLYIFLRHFQVAFENWEPDNGCQLSEPVMVEQHTEYASSPEVVVGCSNGHPTGVILILIEEIVQATGWITEINSSLHSKGLSGASGSMNNRTSELLLVLDALRVVTCSINNCRVLGYYGGVQKLTALMKGAVIQLKTISSALSADDSLSTNAAETVGVLQRILVYVVTVIYGFIDLNSKTYEKAQFCGNHSSNLNDSVTRRNLEWHQKAVLTVMESGGLNWLVELLRVIRRLGMKEQLADMLLQYLTLKTVFLILYDNPRGQNHFKSIGGLEVLLDGLGLPSTDVLLRIHPYNLEEGSSNPLLKVFQLHLLSLDVLKEAVFGNSNNLQFLCENGRVQKFANSFCSPAFMLYDYQQHVDDGSVSDVLQLSLGASKSKSCSKKSADVNADETCASFSKLWNDYASMLSKLLCSFVLYPENIESQLSNSRIATPLSSLYCELSIKWVLRVLVAVFPSIKACSDQNHLPGYLRIFASTLQQFVLNAFKKVLVSSPVFLEVFRGEGIWNLIFSENFFYFGSASDESSDGYLLNVEASKGDCEAEIPYNRTGSQIKSSAVGILQMEIISFIELAASLSITMHNLPEISALLDAMEQSACSPDVANVLAKCLLNILQLSHEKTVASFMTLNAASRVLKVACIQARELRRFDDVNPPVKTNHGKDLSTDETYKSWFSCMEICMEIFMEYFSSTNDARISILHSSDCIDCLFELFWEDNLRNHVLEHIFKLMKYIPLGEENQKAKLLVCSRYLEMFTQMKERERNFADLAVVLLVGIKDIVKNDPAYYQALFREGECFLHVVSLLNANLDEADGEHLVLNVLQTLTCLLASNDASKVAFRALTGKGYPTLHSLLLNFCQRQPSERLLNALLDMLVDGKFDIRSNLIIKNEDVIVLYLSVLQKSSDSLRCDGLNLFQQLVRDSISNRASCVRAEMLNFLLDWFPEEDNENAILKISQLVQVIGGHSISGKDIRKIFALLRSKKIGNRQRYSSLLLACLLSMLNEKGPTAFFDMNGTDSGIVITSPIQWPVNKGYSFSCWLRVESFPKDGNMGIFSFLSNNGKGCFAVLSRDSISYVSSNLKRQSVKMDVNLVNKKWHFLCLTHTIRRAFSGGSLLRCYVDGVLVSSEKCSYAKVNDLLASCSIGTRIMLAQNEDNEALEFMQNTVPFIGQIGPVYLFNDALSSEQIKAIHSLGPSYMFSFLGNETTAPFLDNPLPRGILDGLASKVIFGLSAQASDGRKLFNVSRISEHLSNKSLFDARVMLGTQLCSRRLLQQIIYCVGGISVFFPLITQSDRYEIEDGPMEDNSVMRVAKEHLTAEVIELVASVLDENLANQQQMSILSGFPVLGLLLQSVPHQQLNLETLSSLKHLYNIVSSSELLVEDAMSSIFLNPVIWLQAAYDVQRDLYLFVIQQFDNNPELLRNLCRLPRVIDMIHQFYWDVPNSCSLIGSSQAIGQRPGKEEIHKTRLLLLSLGEMSLRQNITAADVNALAAFFETSQDVACIEDVLHTVIRAVSQTSLLASFLEQVNAIGGCHIFINLLQSDYEPIRLLSLQFLGRLLVGLPSEKKGLRLFNLAVGRSRSHSESQKQFTSRTQSFFLAMCDRLFRFPKTDNFCATLFDVLLGGASPKQVLQKHNQLDKQKSKGSNSNFLLPQILILIFKFLSSCEDGRARMKIISDLLDLLDSNPLNIEALMESGWSAWLSALVKLDVIRNYKPEPTNQDGSAVNEQHFVRNLFSVVLCHYILSVRGGWQLLEETVNFLSLQSEQICISYQHLLRDIFEDLVQHLVDLSSEENMFVSQPCRDNVMFLLQLFDEMLINEIDNKFQFPGISSDLSLDLFEFEGCKSYGVTSDEVSREAFDEASSRNPIDLRNSETTNDGIISENWWNIYDKLWILICGMNGKKPAKSSTKSSASSPSLGQRARGLVESLNIPAAEMAAVVVSGGLGNALSGKVNKSTDKAMLLRGDKCPRIVFRLVILYLSRSSLERASKCVQQVISLLPSFLAADDEQSKNRLHLLIGYLLTVRSQYGTLDDGARFHVISHLIRETISSGKSVLVTSALGRDESPISGSFCKEAGSIHTLIQKDRLLAAVSDEASYTKSLKLDRTRQLSELRDRMNEISSLEDNSKKSFEDDLSSTLNTILASDNSRRGAVQLSHDEQQQNVAEKWVHMLRFLMDERGPWSAIPFPNEIVKYWKLDKTEDSLRRRQKLRRNYHFNERLCLPPSACPEDETPSVVDESKSGFVANMPEKMKRFLLKGVRMITDEGSSESCESESDISGQNILDVPPLSQLSKPIKGGGDQMDGMQEKAGSSSSLEMENREVLISVPCVLITPKRKMAGRLAVMKNMLHFFGEFFVEGSGGSAVFKNFGTLKEGISNKPDHKQQYVKWPSHLDLTHEKRIVADSVESESFHHKKLINVKRHRRWNIAKVRAVHWMRYLLQYTAIEVFFSNSIPPVFLNFASQKEAKEIGTVIVASRNELLFPKGTSRDKAGVISLVDRRAALGMAEIARESWRRRDITNFEYLMILNTLAGRSYNDLTQYPVFPWVLADYSSETLDFNKASTFRDLSKPVGALDPKRLEVFEDRYHSFSDPDIPSFYYGSHYSSMGIVLYYLLRLEPFTSLHRSLQGGKFDHADRLFQSIEGTFRNCLSNTSDVKELIPEFFYMPEFLVNSNYYHLGVKQDGDPLGDVCLPPWAKGSPELFISRNREALESEYVSSHLHNWIDLIFGYKQRGKPAVEAANIFYYLTYEGAVDLNNMEDELQKSAIEDQIANFGQTPIQIFRKRHPRRGPPNPIAHPLYFAPASINLTSVVPTSIHPALAIQYLGLVDSNIVIVNQGLTLSVKMWLTTHLQSGGNFTFSGSQDPFFGVGSDVLSPRNIGSPLAENVDLGSQCFTTIQTSSENFLVSCGNWENSFQIISLTDGQAVQSIRHHKDVVSCIAATHDWSILATGSYDTTVMVWDVVRVRSPEKRARNTPSDALRKDYIVAETPFHILCGHDDIITCLYVSVDLDIVISGSKDGTCVFHTLREGRYIRSLKLPSGNAVSKLVGTRHGRIVLYAEDDLSLHLYSINGKHLASSESNGRLNCLEISGCGEFLVCAGDQGQIVVRSMNSLEAVRRYNGIGKMITSLTVTPEECFLAGTKDGSLLVYSIENPQVRKHVH